MIIDQVRTRLNYELDIAETPKIEVHPAPQSEPAGIYVPDGNGEYVKVVRPPRKLGFRR